MRRSARWRGAPRERSPRLGHRHYPLALSWMDSGIGMVTAALRSSGHEQNTMVIFTSDHHSYDKRHCYTRGSNVPLLLRWPEEWEAGVVVKHLHREPNMPQGMVAPYQVQLDCDPVGSMIWAPHDDDAVIRALPGSTLAADCGASSALAGAMESCDLA